MFEFIPINQYSGIFYNFIFFIVLFTVFHCSILKINTNNNLYFINLIGYFLFFILIFYVGLRPVHGVFVDMTTYAYTFSRFQSGNPINITEDKGFYAFMDFCAQNLNQEFFFFLCAVIYVVPIFIFSKIIFKEFWFYSFIMFVSTFTFWAYATNGIRNGMATSIFMLAIAFYDRKWIMTLFFVLAFSFHKSTVLPMFAFLVAFYAANPKFFVVGWLTSIFLSLAFGGFWEGFFASLGLAGDRATYLTDKADPSEFSSTGFRWDFLLYSLTGVLTGAYAIFKLHFKDRFYDILYCTYLLTNAFWILVIRANFSNRFAYLSWFLLGIIIIYPFIKSVWIPNQNRIVGRLLLGFFAFSYFFNFILAK